MIREQQLIAEAEAASRRSRVRKKLDLSLGTAMKLTTTEWERDATVANEWRRQQPELLDGGQGKQMSRTRVGRGKRSPGTTVRKVRQRGTRRQQHAKVQRVQSRRGTVVGNSYAPGKPAGSTLASEMQSDAARSENLTDHACSPLKAAGCCGSYSPTDESCLPLFVQSST